uniref:Reverse transcriptase zinc-binding domain-containing protein n=1 Tax=Arundo donax TaxID=35708 RepID=A0A0A8XVJ3_ARUDO
MHGKRLLDRGIIWRGGNGENIRLAQDKWVPDSPCHPIIPKVQLPEDTRVSFLIDEAAGSWNEEVVYASFNEADAKRILSIPLSQNPLHDFVSWLHTRTGIYTVKSAYVMARTESAHLYTSASGRGATSNQTSTSKEWKRLWGIRAPPKVRIILWRFAHNCLPTGQQLKSRNIPAPDVCYHCGREETMEHVFLTCQYTAEIWRELKRVYGMATRHINFVNAGQWLFDFLARSTEQEATILAISFWRIWEARNGMRNGDGVVHPHCIAGKILAYGDMVLMHLYESAISNRCDPPHPKRWAPPREGWVMVNVDAAVFAKPDRMGIGIVIRDHNSCFLVACRQTIEGITVPELAEALAIRRAVLLTSELEYNQALIASDCLSLVQKLRLEGNDRSHAGVIIQDIKQAARGSSAVFSFIHVNRCCNGVAHVLARSADQLCDSVWTNEAPEVIRASLCND